ncbi:hypothetical protein BGY98DRAFT_986988 [Russula aff. rugulosa BPL654]|nr:hypothetical protein BGY98DRAFT_986988 [Russula aff. rugulosa BPL654]
MSWAADRLAWVFFSVREKSVGQRLDPNLTSPWRDPSFSGPRKKQKRQAECKTLPSPYKP